MAAPPAAMCAKQKPKLGTWPERYVKIEGRSLNFYDNQADARNPKNKRGSSIKDVTGVKVLTQGEDGIEKFTFSTQKKWFKITLERRGHPTQDDLDDGGFSRFCFRSEHDRDTFRDALQHLSEGRRWDGSFASGSWTASVHGGAPLVAAPGVERMPEPQVPEPQVPEPQVPETQGGTPIREPDPIRVHAPMRPEPEPEAEPMRPEPEPGPEPDSIREDILRLCAGEEDAFVDRVERIAKGQTAVPLLKLGQPRWEIEPPHHEDGWKPLEMSDCRDLTRYQAPEGIRFLTEPSELAPDVRAEQPTNDGSEPRKVRITAPMTLADAVAWQACIEGNFERLTSALENGANPDFRGPAYDCGTLLHLACNGGRMECARRLLERGADALARDKHGENALDILKRRDDLQHMFKFLHEMVEDALFEKELAKATEDCKARLNTPNALKNWLVEGPGPTPGRRRRVLICGQKRENRKEVLEVAEFRSNGWVEPSDVDPTSKIDHEAVADGLKHDGTYKLLRQATPAECRAVDADTNLEDVSQGSAISVRSGPLERNDRATTVYTFDIFIANEKVHTISGRYSKLARHYAALPSALGCPPSVSFPDSRLIASRLYLTESAQKEADKLRQEELRKYFQDVLDVTGEYGDRVDQVHEILHIEERVRRQLRDAVRRMSPQGAPSEAVPQRGTVIAKDDRQYQWTPRSDRAVCADFRALVDGIETSTDEPASLALSQAAAAARCSGCTAVLNHAKAVEAQSQRAKCLEGKQRDAKEQRDYYAKHDEASEALHAGKELMKERRWGEAIDKFTEGLNIAAPTDSDGNMRNRWDLEMWCNIAAVRQHLQRAETSDDIGGIWNAVKELEKPRSRPDVLWSLDATCTDGLLESAVYSAFEAMGIPKERTAGQLPVLRDKIIADIAEKVAETKERVETVSKVLSNVNGELERLCHSVDGTVRATKHVVAEDSVRAQITEERSTKEMCEDSWKEIVGGEDAFVTEDKLQEALDTLSVLQLRAATPEDLADLDRMHPERCGKYDYHDFKKLIQQLMPTEESRILHESFQTFDRNGDTQITATEIQHVMSSLGWQLTASELDEIIREGDRAGTGQISEDDFCAMMRKGSLSEVSNPLASTLDIANSLSRKEAISSKVSSDKHRPLPALIAATEAVSTASRFCSFAAKAGMTEFEDAPDLHTQHSMRRSGLANLQLQSNCVGTQMWAYAIASLVLSQRDCSQPPVTFGLPGPIPHGQNQCNIDQTISVLRDKIGQRVSKLREELQRRNFVRVNTECGELALSQYRATDALNHFDRALKKAKTADELLDIRGSSPIARLRTDSTSQRMPVPEPEPEPAVGIGEQAQLQERIDLSKTEKQRQENVKDLHSKATSALSEQGQKGDKGVSYTEGGAKFAISRYLEAIKCESGTDRRADSSELQALTVMHALAQSWHAGDDAMKAWDGCSAKKKYVDAKRQARHVEQEQFLPTEGYAGGRIVLCDAAEAELEACIDRAQQEIDRKNDFEAKIRLAEDHLAERRAESAKETFEAANKVATHKAEADKAADGARRAENELSRQKNAKEPVQQGMGLMARCNPTEWTQGGARPQPAEWRQAAEEAQTAIQKCTDGLRYMEEVDGERSLQSQVGTPDHCALQFLREACESWKKADEHMAEWEGEHALRAFEHAKSKAHEARNAGETPGYFGDPCHMTPGAEHALLECIKSAKLEIERSDDLDANEESARADFAKGAAGDAKKVYQRLLERAEADAEKKRFQQLLEEAQQEEARQLGVFELHQKGVRALKANEPEIAKDLYNEALKLEAPYDESSALSKTKSGRNIMRRTEPESLQHMLDISVAWMQGNAALLDWDGVGAESAFKVCRDHADAADQIRRTPGYAGAKICLGQATPELEACESRAKAEKQRNEQFERLTKVGEAALQAWRAEDARGCFAEAASARVVGFVLKFHMGKQPIVRAENEKERIHITDCLQRAEAEMDRQKRVKDAVSNAVRVLEENSASPAIKRREEEKPIAAKKFCEQALKHALSTDGALKAQEETTETHALRLLRTVAAQWKRGDDALAVWKGEEALRAYSDAKTNAQHAAAKMQQPTEGYVEATTCKVELSALALRQLDDCITEARDEIERKKTWTTLFDEGTEHLLAWRAQKAMSCCQRAEKLSDECKQGRNQIELDAVAKLTSDSNAELHRQIEVKKNVSKALQGLELPSTRVELKCAHRWAEGDRKTPIDYCKQALVCASSENGELRSQKVPLQNHEYRALELLLYLCEEWKIGDEAMEDSRGRDAKAKYDKCHSLSKQLIDTECTPGYFVRSDEELKIQLTPATAKALLDCSTCATAEIDRTRDRDRIKGDADHVLAQVDRAATHLQLPGRSGCQHCHPSLNAGSSSHSSHCGLARPHAYDSTLVVVNTVDHLEMCYGCAPDCPDALGRDRWSIVSPHELQPYYIHSVKATLEYLEAYERSRCEREKFEIVEALNDAANALSSTLGEERSAYADRARRTQNYLYTSRGMSANDLRARDGLGAGVGWAGGPGLLDTLKQVAEWNRSCSVGGTDSTASQAPWRRPGDPVITAERIYDELDEALAELDKMEATNQKIREMPTVKRKNGGAVGSSNPAPEFDMAEASEGEEDDDSAPVIIEHLDPLDELIDQRNRERKRAVQLGDRYRETASRLSLQQKSVKQMAAHLSLYVTQLERRHAELRRWSEICGAWQLAGCSVPRCTREGKLQMERIELKGIFRREKVVLDDVDVSLQGEDLHISDIMPVSNALEDPAPVSLRGATVEPIDPRVVEGMEGDMEVGWAMRLQNGKGRDVQLVAKDKEERDHWCDNLKRRIELIDKADKELEPHLEREPGQDEGTEGRHGCLAEGQRYAEQAVQRLEHWKHAIDHTALHQETDDKIDQLRARVEEIGSSRRFDDRRSTFAANAHGLQEVKQDISDLRALLDEIRKSIGAERAMRELCPLELLRAMMWGIGELFPQLSQREVEAMHDRYKSAHASAKADTLCEGVRRDVRNQELRDSIEKLVTPPKHGESECGGLFRCAQLSKQALREELSFLDTQSLRARDENLDDRVESCRPHVDSTPPNTDRLDELQDLVKEQKEALTDAVHLREKLKARREDYPEGHARYPSDEEWERANRAVKAARRALRATSKLVDSEMQQLARQGSEHWPEVLNSAPNLNDFKRMDFLRTDGTIESYDNVTPLRGKGRNSVYTATLDDREVVLKQYDLTEASTINKVMEEVRALHKMRHENIVVVESVFEEKAAARSIMYLQMPKYKGDLKDWLDMHQPPPPEPRRRILLGVIRGIARVHEFNFTHNDIKLENILLSEAGDAVLCDFELLREEAAYKDAADTATTVVGGTPAYMAPERVSNAPPTRESDMYSFGVVLLLCFAPDRIKDVTQPALVIESTDEGVVRERLCEAIVRKLSPRERDVKQQELTSLPIEKLKLEAEKLHRVPPETVRSQIVSDLPPEVNEYLRKLLHQSAAKRPAAADMLPEVASTEGNYFSKATLDLPIYWEPGDNEIVEVKDEETKTKLWRAIQPQQPDEFGKGRDNGKHWEDLNLQPTDRFIRMHKAWRVQNSVLWKTYATARERMQNDVSRGPPLDSDEPPVCNREVLMRPRQGDSGGCSEGGQRLEHAARKGFTQGHEDRALPAVNEAFLLHGLPKTTLISVLQGGFNERYSGANAGALFGYGTYFAQDIEKADQYTGDADQCFNEAGMELLHSKLYPEGEIDHPGEPLCYVLVCRVALGYTIRTKGRHKDPNTNQWSNQCVAMDGRPASDTNLVFVNDAARELVKLPGKYASSGVHYHSLLAETSRGGLIERFREFVTYNCAYTYPEFVVAYKRCSRAEGSEEIDGQLLLQRRMKQIVREYEDSVKAEQRQLRAAALVRAAAGRDTRTLPLRILCIDGGGIKGLIPAVVLHELQKLCDDTPIRELFDMVCGTSTGGIIALGTCVGDTNIEAMVDIYKNRAADIWKEKGLAARMKGGASGGKYDASGLEQILKEHSMKPGGGQFKLNHELQAWPKVFVTTVKMAQAGEESTAEGELELLKSYEEPSVGDCELWQAGRATGAAPTYLDPMEIGGHKFVDGGIKANNPTMRALEEARRLFPGRKIGCILSLGCGLERHARSGSGFKALSSVVTDPEETHRDVLTKVMGIELPQSDRVSELGRQTHLGCERGGDCVYSEWLSDDAIYARINPEIEFQWSNSSVRMDTKDPGDLENLEKVANAFVRDAQVRRRLDKVCEKLCESEDALEPEPEPESDVVVESSSHVDWCGEVAQIVDELEEITAEEAWKALADVADGAPNARQSVEEARRVSS